jgi:transposase
MSMGEIYDLIGMKSSSQFNIYRRWKKNGFKLIKRDHAMKGRHQYVNQEQVEWICN